MSVSYCLEHSFIQKLFSFTLCHFERSSGVKVRTWSFRWVVSCNVLSKVSAAVFENESERCPGVGLAHVKRVGCFRAEAPACTQVVKVATLADSSCGVGVVIGEALVDAAVAFDGLKQT